MKKILFASLAALAFATPALAADFTGPRVSGVIGFSDEDFAGTEAFVYGANVGYDMAFGNIVAGVTAEFMESGEDFVGRDLSVVGRAGIKLGEQALVYALAGYTNLGTEDVAGELDGVRLGAGVELAFTPQIFANVEYRYSNYERDAETHHMLVGLGFRF